MRKLLLACLIVTGCASLRPVALHKSSSQNDAALKEAANAFYSAKDVASLKASVAKAVSVAPDSPLSNELQAQYALLEGNERAAVAHLIAAVQDADDPDVLLHLKTLFECEWTDSEQRQIEALLELLSTDSPNADARAYAAFRLTLLRRDLDLAGADEAEARITGRLPLALIGSWDNDQGKGFDLALPPETEAFNANAEYAGLLRPLHWRSEVPLSPGGVYPLSEALQPNRFAIAYATGAFSLAAPAEVELRLRSGDALKVWIDGALLASVREVKEQMFDQFVLPVRLPAGNHRVLIKSANRDSGSWSLSARVTGPKGEPLAQLAALEPMVQHALAAMPEVKPLQTEALVDARLAQLPPNEPRSQALRALWLRQVLGGVQAVKEAERAAANGGLWNRFALSTTLWGNGEAGRASDLLVQLSKETQDALPAISAAAYRFQGQQGLKQKARSALMSLIASRGDVPVLHRELATLFDQENWDEDECDEDGKLASLRPGNANAAVAYADCVQKLRQDDQAEQLLRAQLRLTPGDFGPLFALYRFGSSRGRERLAEWAARELVTRHGQYLPPHLYLADLLQRRGAYEEATAELRAAMALSPDAAAPWSQLAQLEYRRGRKTEAAAAWREALARAPEDEKLANRLEFIAPEKPEAWMADVPTETELEALVQKARALKPRPESNYAFVLDNEVQQYRADGSTTSLVTQVLQSFNSDGRDALLKQNIGRARIRIAYAVDSDGRRVEPASVRDGQVRFRSLGERSTVVLQFRRDRAPGNVLGRNLMLTWNFQGVTDQRERSQFILYVPKALELHEELAGDVKRTESVVGDQRRVEWRAEGLAPVGYEPQMPPAYEVTARLHLSSVPSWDTFSRWTEALFQEALRDSPEVRELAKRLFEGTTDPNEKLLRLQTFMMKEIRYEQDYESMIAGVKPHPAPMVLERRYGDCKDKTVLFITLAKLGGIETHYALIRTRDWGAVHDQVPDQQFNHVIVYVPPQQGIAEGRYFDPTADALDLVSLRSDDQGTKSFVLDPVRHTWRFQTVPYQSVAENNAVMNLDVVLGTDGSAQAQVKAAYVGESASAYRRLARNPDLFKRLLGQFASSVFSGSDLKATDPAPDPDDVRAAAKIGVTLFANNVGKREGDELRLSLPRDAGVVGSYKVSSRKHPLMMNVPVSRRWEGTLKLAGAVPSRVPQPTQYQSECLDYRRQVTVENDTVQFDHALDYKCERISPEKYPAAMKAAIEVQRLLEEDVVFSLAPPKGKPIKGLKLTTQTGP